MSVIWGAWGNHWALGNKIEFDGFNKRIIVHPEVVSLDIRADVYKGWVNWLSLSVDNLPWLPAMKFSGLDVIPGGETGGTFFLINNWKLEIDFNKVAVTGILFSENYPTAYWSALDLPLYPAQVSALVNSVTTIQNVVTGDISTVPTALQISNQVWANSTAPTAIQISNQVWANNTAIQISTHLAEVWGRLGLDISKPLITGQTTITFGAIVMAMVESAGAVTVTRQ